MAYTTVITHATGDVLPASDWNTYIRDNLAYLHGNAGTVVLAASVGVGGASAAIGAAAGVLVDATGTVWASQAAAGSSILVGTVVGDVTADRLKISADGTILWGPGNTAQDTTLARVGAGILQLGTTTQAGRLSTIAASAAGIVASAAVTTDANPRYTVQGDGTINWGPGTAGTDTSLFRYGAAQVRVVSKVIEDYANTAVAAFPATWTPGGQYLYNRCGITAGGAGTLTIAAVTSTPLGGGSQTCLYALRIANAGGGTITLAWNAQYVTNGVTALPASVANGATSSTLWLWDPAVQKMILLAVN